MQESRRHWLTKFGGVLGLLVFSVLSAGQSRPPTAQPMPSPNAPNPHAPAGLDRPPMAGSGSSAIDPQLEHKIRTDVQKLYELAFELK